MALIDELEFCHCDLNRNLSALVRITQGETDVTVFACGDKDPDNNYPRMLKARLGSVEAQNTTLFTQLQAKLEEAYPENVSGVLHSARRSHEVRD